MVAISAIDRPTKLIAKDELWVGQFNAMASPCEILMALEDKRLAEELLRIAATEAWRIEQKYSRYRDDSIISRINHAEGKPTEVDAETAQLLDFAYQCYELSDGLFDISSGILRQAWPFNTESSCPSQEFIDTLLPFVGLDKTQWSAPTLTVPPGMQIDLGGIGKEYAVDRTLGLLLTKTDSPLLVNFGGDIACNRGPDPDLPWRIGIESTDQEGEAQELLELRSGALATSGNTQRYLIFAGKRFGHVLNPTTGWPIEESPLSVTVPAANCTRAGMLATFSMLKGKHAEQFLDQQDVKYWAVRQECFL